MFVNQPYSLTISIENTSNIDWQDVSIFEMDLNSKIAEVNLKVGESKVCKFDFTTGSKPGVEQKVFQLRSQSAG